MSNEITMEKLTSQIISMIRRNLGMGAMLFDWDIDLDAGCRITKSGTSTTKSFWTVKGLRTDISITFCPEGPMVMSMQSKEPDPEYLTIRGNKPQKKKRGERHYE